MHYDTCDTAVMYRCYAEETLSRPPTQSKTPQVQYKHFSFRGSKKTTDMSKPLKIVLSVDKRKQGRHHLWPPMRCSRYRRRNSDATAFSNIAPFAAVSVYTSNSLFSSFENSGTLRVPSALNPAFVTLNRYHPSTGFPDECYNEHLATVSSKCRRNLA